MLGAKEQEDMQNTFSKYAILNEVGDKMFDIVQNFISDMPKDALNNIEKCINIIHKIKEIKEGDLL